MNGSIEDTYVIFFKARFGQEALDLGRLGYFKLRWIRLDC